MARILLRAAKGPFDSVSPEATLRHNRVATNSGNLIFSHAAHKILSSPGVEVVPSMNRRDPADAPMINERYDAFVVPLANAFRPDFEDHLEALTTLIERLTIPVVVFGVGAQAELDYDPAPMKPLEGLIRRFISAVLDRSATVGVRGEFTESYLKGLGFKDLDVIGCPSMFMYGENLRVEKKAAELTPQAKIAINVSPYGAAPPTAWPTAAAWIEEMGEVVEHHRRKYPNLIYIAQDTVTLDTLLWGDKPEDAGKTSPVPIYSSHPLFRDNKVRFFADPWTWLSYLAGFDFAFGTRIHGNTAALLAGVPAVVLAHDSRTLELARYFEMPYRKITDVPSDVDAATLYAEADFTAMNKGHKARLKVMTDFLDRNRIDHIFNAGGTNEPFDHTLTETRFPPPTETLFGADRTELVSRLRYLYGSDRDLDRRLGQLAQLGRKLDRLGGRIDAVEKSLTQIEPLRERVAELERLAKTTPYRRARRFGGRMLRKVGVRRARKG